MPKPVTLDFSKAQPIESQTPPITLDFSRAMPIARTQEDKESETRMMMLSGLTGLPTPNMSESDKAEFQRGKAAGALSNVATGALATGVAAAPGTASLALLKQGLHYGGKYGVPGTAGLWLLNKLMGKD